MSHNYTTGREFTTVRDIKPAPVNVDCPTLTISSRRGVDVSFYRNPADELVVNPWGVSGGSAVNINGEDLFALREFLAEFPEDRFVRPADPVERPRWTEGDLIEHVPLGKIYRRGPERWVSIYRGRDLTPDSIPVSDYTVSACVDANPESNVVIRQQSAE